MPENNFAREFPSNPEMENQTNNEGASPEMKKNNVAPQGSPTPASAVAAAEKTATQPLLPHCPEPGAGVHTWIMSAAWTCRRSGVDPEIAVKAITEASTREPGYREVEDAVEKVYGCDEMPAGARTKRPAVDFDPLVADWLADELPGFDAAALSARSPIPPAECSPADFLARLYLPGERVLVFTSNTSQGDYVWTKPAEGLVHDSRELDHLRVPKYDTGVFFLSNPVSGDFVEVQRLVKDWNPTGRSRRCEEAVTSFRYLLLESDKVEAGVWIPVLAQLPLPIAAVYTSGGKSIHALVRIDAKDGGDWREQRDSISDSLVHLGADEAAMSAVRLTRLPGCYRTEKKQWQTLLYLNLEPDGRPIAEQTVRTVISEQEMEVSR